MHQDSDKILCIDKNRCSYVMSIFNLSFFLSGKSLVVICSPSRLSFSRTSHESEELSIIFWAIENGHRYLFSVILMGNSKKPLSNPSLTLMESSVFSSFFFFFFSLRSTMFLVDNISSNDVLRSGLR